MTTSTPMPAAPAGSVELCEYSDGWPIVAVVRAFTPGSRAPAIVCEVRKIETGWQWRECYGYPWRDCERPDLAPESMLHLGAA